MVATKHTEHQASDIDGGQVVFMPRQCLIYRRIVKIYKYKNHMARMLGGIADVSNPLFFYCQYPLQSHSNPNIVNQYSGEDLL